MAGPFKIPISAMHFYIDLVTTGLITNLFNPLFSWFLQVILHTILHRFNHIHFFFRGASEQIAFKTKIACKYRKEFEFFKIYQTLHLLLHTHIVSFFMGNLSISQLKITKLKIYS